MIQPRILRALDLDVPSAPGRPHHVASGSGLVAAGEFLYVLPDDELHLACFHRSSGAPGSLVRLFPGELPNKHAERKAAKPDLEALVRLPAFTHCPDGALLAVPSGSTPQRCKGALLGLDAEGAITGDVRAIDFSGLYAALADQVPGLDVEGAVVVDDALVLMHRGNRTHPLSALIELSLAEILVELVVRDAIDARSPRRVSWVDLGTVEGVPLTITDGAILPGGCLLVTAVAEDSADSYADGPCVGAAIGLVDITGRVFQVHHLQPVFKIEGVQALVENGAIRLLLVTDSDDESSPGYLLEAELVATGGARAAVPCLPTV